MKSVAALLATLALLIFAGCASAPHEFLVNFREMDLTKLSDDELVQLATFDPEERGALILEPSDTAIKARALSTILERHTQAKLPSSGANPPASLARQTPAVGDPWLSDVIESIRSNKLSPGMRKIQAMLVVGVPVTVNKSEGQDWRREQWVIRSHPSIRYVYFENDRVKSWDSVERQ